MSTAVWLGIGASAGALALDAMPGAAVLLAGLALLVVASVRQGRPPRAALALGIVAIGLRGLLGPTAASGPTALPDGDGPWTATVVSVGSPKAGTRPAVISIDAPSAIMIAATFPWYPEVVPGDRIEAGGSLEPPPKTEYATYLARVGAAGTLRASSVAILPAPPGPGRWLEGLRRGADAALMRAIPEPEAGLAAGILVGLRDRVDRDLAAAFTTAGASHVVAISGWNIAIVATTLGALAGGLGRRRRSVLTGIAIGAYVLFVGPSPSVLRAGAMAGIALAARELGRPSRAAGAMGLAVAVLLLLSPSSIDDPGFRLSVLATAGLMAWGTRLSRRLAGPAPGRLRAWLAESLGVSLAAQAATLPVILLEFGRLSLVAPLVNLGVVPLVAPAMGAGTLALVAGALTGLGAPGAVAIIGGLPAWVLLGAIVTMIRAGASVPLASVTLAAPWDVIASIVSAVAILLLARFGSRVRRWREPRNQAVAPKAGATDRPRGRRVGPRRRADRLALFALVGATIALALAITHRPDGTTRVTVLDVGQGDAILVEGSRGGRMLVDGGPDPGRLLIALDERLPAWDHRIDTLILTHPHEDHAAGLAALLARYRVGRIFEPGMIGPGPGYVAMAAALANGGPPHGTLATGDRLTLDDIRFRVLWPDPGRVPLHPADGGTAINNVSIVLLGEVGSRRFLLAGDIEEGVDPELLARGLPTVDLLKVAHHGSRTSSTSAFLDAVHPRIAVVSAGLGNPYGHPAPATIDRLRAVAQQTYRTDHDGSVEVRFDADAMRVRTSGPRPAANATEAGAAASRSVAGPPAAAPGSATTFACSIPEAQGVPQLLPTVAEAPGLTIEPEPPRAALAAGAWHLRRLPEAPSGSGRPLLYHRPDDGPLAPGGEPVGPPAERPLRLLLGRRRVRPRRGGRGVPPGRDEVPRGPARTLASPHGSQRRRPSRGGGERTPRDRLDVRRGDARARDGPGHARSAEPGA